MSASVGFWESINSPNFVCKVIKKGFSLSFLLPFIPITPEQNRPSAFKHANFVSQEISELLQSKSVIECLPEDLECISPLMVAEGKKLRLILDLSYLNKFLPKTQFSLEDLKHVIELLPPKGFLAKFDFRKGYHHVSMSPESQKFLGFTWDYLGQKRFFKFTVLPFGLSIAPWLFTKLFRPLVKRWRTRGIGVVLYLDDGLVFGETRERTQEAIQSVVADLNSAGITLAVEKSVLSPTQVLEYLGCVIDLKNDRVAISPERVEKTLDRLNVLQNSFAPTIHDRMRFVGSIISMHIVVPDAVIRTRATSTTIAEAQSVDSQPSLQLKPSQGEKEEWNLWKDRLQDPVERAIPLAIPNKGELFFFSDASASGVGAILYAPDKTFKSSGRFSNWEKTESSTLRELKAILFGLKAFEKEFLISKKLIVIHCDNQPAVSILKKGSIKPHLQEIALEIENFRKGSGLVFDYRWVPRDENGAADALSRDKDWADWGIKDEVAKIMMARFGKCTVDLFADNSTTKCPKFYSRFSCPDSAGVDAFSFPEAWGPEHFAWCVPPPKFLARVLSFAYRHKSTGILGIPKWESHIAWPFLLQNGSEWRNFVQGTFEYGGGAPILIPSKSGALAFDSEQTKSPFIFIKYDFSRN